MSWWGRMLTLGFVPFWKRPPENFPSAPTTGRHGLWTRKHALPDTESAGPWISGFPSLYHSLRCFAVTTQTITAPSIIIGLNVCLPHWITNSLKTGKMSHSSLCCPCQRWSHPKKSDLWQLWGAMCRVRRSSANLNLNPFQRPHNCFKNVLCRVLIACINSDQGSALSFPFSHFRAKCHYYIWSKGDNFCD